MTDQLATQAVNDKLILLYVYSSIGIPINPMDVGEIILKLDLMEYYQIGHYTAELLSTGMLELLTSEGAENYLITQSGNNTLSLFQERLPEAAVEALDNAVADLKKRLKRHRIINTQVQKLEADTFLVHLRIMEGVYPLIDLAISVASNAQANQLVDKWQRDAVAIYGSIIGQLTET